MARCADGVHCGIYAAPVRDAVLNPLLTAA